MPRRSSKPDNSSSKKGNQATPTRGRGYRRRGGQLVSCSRGLSTWKYILYVYIGFGPRMCAREDVKVNIFA